MINLTTIDWSIIVGYGILAIAIGVLLSGKATQNVEEYFVAGRKFPWWVAGTSLVATSFAADTPLALSGIIRTKGLQGNWYWWSGVMAFMLCAVLFARLWQRGRFITDAEIYELRYEGRAAKILRAYTAAHRSIFLNCITMGWVTLAMTKIIGVLFDIPTLVVLDTFDFHWIPSGQTIIEAGITGEHALFVADEKIIGVVACIFIAVTYAMLAGMWGVAATDLIQFVIAMVGSISLAVVSVRELGGLASMREKVIATIETYGPGLETDGFSTLADSSQILNFAPDLSAGGLAVATFIIYITMQWWGGSEGGGFLAQRLFTCKNERHGTLAMLWFSVAHFVIRFWPWAIVGFASIAIFPQLKDAEQAYPMMIEFLPTGLKGLMVASLLAAFMSTIDTHLNWGSSYIVTDLYKRFLVKDASAGHYVRIGQVANLVLMILAGITAVYMDSIYSAWLYLAEVGAGVVLASLFRWFWWRVNVWSEISAMVSSLVLTNAFRLIGLATDIPFFASDDWFAIRLVVIIFSCTAVWLAVTFLTSPVSNNQLRSFYTRIQPPGFWAPVRVSGDPATPPGMIRRTLISWLSGVASIYCLLIGSGKLLLTGTPGGWVLVAASIGSAAVMIRSIDLGATKSMSEEA